jgi:hypothetical protein
MLGPHTHRHNPLSRILCAPITPPVTVCKHLKIEKKTSVNIFETSKSDEEQYFVASLVDKVKDKRRTNHRLAWLS